MPAKKRKPRGSLSQGAILDAARDLLREEGLESMSIRKIANALNAGTMSIYNHFDNKQQIVAALVADFVKRAHNKNHDESDVKLWLINTFNDIYHATVSEPEYLLLMINSSNIGLASLDVFEEAMRILVAADLTPEDAAKTFQLLLSHTLRTALLATNIVHEQDSSSLNVAESDYPNVAEHWNAIHSLMGGEGFHSSLKLLVNTTITRQDP